MAEPTTPIDRDALVELCSRLEASGNEERPDSIPEIWAEALERLRTQIDSEAREWAQALGLSSAGLEAGLDVMLTGASREVATRMSRRVAGGPGSASSGPSLKAVFLTPSPPLLVVQALLPALLARSPLLIKVSSREPSLGGTTLTELLVRCLSECSPELGQSVATVRFPGGTRASEELEEVLFERSQRLVVYGGSAAIGSLEQRFAGRHEGRLITHGPKLSLAMVDRSSLAERSQRQELAKKTGARRLLVRSTRMPVPALGLYRR